MINVRRLTVIAFLGAGLLPGISAQESSMQTAAQSEMNLPAQWDLQSCIDYALQQNITIRKNRVNAESTQIDVKTAKSCPVPQSVVLNEPEHGEPSVSGIKQNDQRKRGDRDNQQDQLQWQLWSECFVDHL